MFKRFVMAGVACGVVAAAAWVQAASPPRQAAAPRAHHETPHSKPGLDRSGRTRIGKASFYSGKLSGRRMADGTRLDPHADSAASKTLPLGTTARVTNLETGQSAVVTIRDRGPHVRGRIVDLTPATARKVGIGRHEGVSRVAVTPIDMPASGEAATKPDASRDKAVARRHRRSSSTPMPSPR